MCSWLPDIAVRITNICVRNSLIVSYTWPLLQMQHHDEYRIKRGHVYFSLWPLGETSGATKLCSLGAFYMPQYGRQSEFACPFVSLWAPTCFCMYGYVFWEVYFAGLEASKYIVESSGKLEWDSARNV